MTGANKLVGWSYYWLDLSRFIRETRGHPYVFRTSFGG